MEYALDGFTMYVRCFKFDNDSASWGCWKRAQLELSNVSCWRTTTPERDDWFVVVCGREDHWVDWSVFENGIEIEMPEEQATPFLMRRLKLSVEAKEAGFGEIRQENHYEDGARITRDGETVSVSGDGS